MRGRFFRLVCLAVLGVGAACASSEDEAPPSPSPDGGDSTLGDGGIADSALPDHAVPADADAETPPAAMCSPAGWCVTEMPDPKYNISDIWPLEKRAFGLVLSAARGRKVVEWSGDIAQGSGWTYIDDNTPQDFLGVMGNVWAPSEDEVYYSMGDYSAFTGEGRYGGYIYHAFRPVAPAKTWVWKRYRFDCDEIDTPTVWGSSKSDVYVMSCKKIYHLTGELEPDGGAAGDSGAPAGFTIEYAYEEPVSLQFLGAVGTADDIWFVGGSGYSSVCAWAVRKHGGRYERVFDGTVNEGTFKCLPKPGFQVSSRFNDYFSPSPGVIIGTPVFDPLVRVADNGAGGYTVTSANPGPSRLGGVWTDSPDELWLVTDYRRILHGTGVWGASPSFQYSTIALNGNPNQNTIARIRGTSKTNLWAVGDSLALHKTTP